MRHGSFREPNMQLLDFTPVLQTAGLSGLAAVVLGGLIGATIGWAASRLANAFVTTASASVEDRRLTCAQSGFLAGAVTGMLLGGTPGALIGGTLGAYLGWS
jgi:hypothetical protein